MPCNSVSDLFFDVLRSSVSILCQSHLSRSDSSTFGAIPQQLSACRFRTQPLPVPSRPRFVALYHRHAVRLHSLLFLRFAILFVSAPCVTNASPSGSSRAIPQHSKLFRCFSRGTFFCYAFSQRLVSKPFITLAVLRGSGLSPSAAMRHLSFPCPSWAILLGTEPFRSRSAHCPAVPEQRGSSRNRSWPCRCFSTRFGAVPVPINSAPFFAMLHLRPTARDIADPLRIDSGRRDASAMRYRLQQFRSLASLIGAGPFLRHAPVFKATPLPFRAFQFAAIPHRRHYVPFYARPRSALANPIWSLLYLHGSSLICTLAKHIQSPPHNAVTRHRCRRGCPPARPREPPAAST